jgi:hypothetical protein
MFRYVFSPPPTLETDFNELDHNSWLTATRLPYAAFFATFDIGTKVRLADVEGNTCWGIIREINGPLYIVEPDWSTWRDQLTPQVNGAMRADANVTLHESERVPA